jgi:hypothetical protein
MGLRMCHEVSLLCSIDLALSYSLVSTGFCSTIVKRPPAGIFVANRRHKYSRTAANRCCRLLKSGNLRYSKIKRVGVLVSYKRSNEVHAISVRGSFDENYYAGCDDSGAYWEAANIDSDECWRLPSKISSFALPNTMKTAAISTPTSTFREVWLVSRLGKRQKTIPTAWLRLSGHLTLA